MYLESTAIIYLPNGAIESQHPSAFEIDGAIYPIDIQGFLWEHAELPYRDRGGYFTYQESPLIKFKYLPHWENDCNRNGSRIRWHLPKGSKAIY
jgi:hypothetical protein